MAVQLRQGAVVHRAQVSFDRCTKISSPNQNGDKMMNHMSSVSIFLVRASSLSIQLFLSLYYTLLSKDSLMISPLIFVSTGFLKGQIKVTTEGRNTIRVRGERLVAGNKWSRFLEDFQVPENGEMKSIQAKFEGGVLNIKVPKTKVEKKPQETIIPKEHKQPTTPIEGRDKVGTSQPTDEKSLEPKETSSSGDSGTIKGQDDDQKQPTIAKSLEPQKGSSDGRNEPNHQRQGRFPEDDEKKGSSESKEKQTTPEKTDDLTRKTESDEAETGKKATTMEKDGAMHEKKEAFGGMMGKKEKYKKKAIASAVVKELNEERQLLVNMGVALLVIVALTANITHQFATPNHK